MQAEAKAQMVLVTETNKRKSGDQSNIKSATLNPCSFAFVEDDKVVSHPAEQDANCDILMTPKLVENGNSAGTDRSVIHNGGTSKMPLNSIEQAIILAQCLVIRNTNPDDEWQGRCQNPLINVDARTL